MSYLMKDGDKNSCFSCEVQEMRISGGVCDEVCDYSLGWKVFIMNFSLVDPVLEEKLNPYMFGAFTA